MALSNAERQRRYRERKRKEASEVKPEAGQPVRRTFAEYINSTPEYIEAIDTAFEWLNASPIRRWEDWIERDNAVDICMNFIGDRHTDGAVAGAWTIAALVNSYKIEQIDAQIFEIENSDLSTPALKKAADMFVKQLRHTRAQLQRNNRYEFPPMWVEGE